VPENARGEGKTCAFLRFRRSKTTRRPGMTAERLVLGQATASWLRPRSTGLQLGR
jgi:hypothetical protein